MVQGNLGTPELILLDVMMHGINGFEVCARLKQSEPTKAIPVIMVTALTEKEHRVKAMESGADDFLSKPVDQTELVVRVKSLLRIKSYRDDLLASYREIADKNAKLEELEKVRDGLAHMIIHDLRNPLTAISTFLQLTLMEKENLKDSQQEKLDRCQFFCQELEAMIQNLLDISKMEERKMELKPEPTDLRRLIQGVMDRFSPAIAEREIFLKSEFPRELPAFALDPSLIKRVIVNLVDNAIRYTPKQGTVALGVDWAPENGGMRLSVKDSGRGLAPEYHQRIFNKFEQVNMKKEGYRAGSSGLGLTFCKMAVEAHGGKIWVESEGEGKGCTFWIQLPVVPQDQG
jgi:signal transduction histidine kinase